MPNNSKRENDAVRDVTNAAARDVSDDIVASMKSQMMMIKSEPTSTKDILVSADFVASTATLATSLTTTQGLPSPASSTSETSDYQRSTPSPRTETTNGKFYGRLSSLFIVLVLVRR